MGHAEPNVELFSPFEVIQEPSAILYRKPLPVSLNNTLPKPLLTPSLPAPLPFVAIIKTAKPKVPEKNFRELADLGEFEAALAACDRSIAKNKLNSVTYFYRALICEQMARYSDSERDLRQSIFLNPSFPLAHYYLGLCCLHKNDVDGALHSFANVQNLLANLDSNIVFNEGDGISAKELLELSHYHMINLRAA